LAESVTDPPEKLIVIVSVKVGVISKAYSSPEPVRLLALPFSTLMLSAVNPLIGSLKVMDMGIGDVFAGDVRLELMIAVGCVRSETQVLTSEALL